MKRLFFTSLLMVLSFAPKKSFSQPESLVDLMQEIETVVTATLAEMKITEAPATIYSYSGDELRRWGIRNIGELLNMIVPGVILTEDGDETIGSFRGVATDNNCKVLALVDGHKVQPQWAKGATPELELGFIENIDKVEIEIGPGSALFGSGATIGVINIITKKATTERNRFDLSTGFGSGWSHLIDAAVSTTIDEKTSVNASLGISRSEGYPKRDDSPKDNWPLYISRQPKNKRLFLNLNHGDIGFVTRYTSVSRALYNGPVSSTKGGNYEVWDYWFTELYNTFQLQDNLKVRVSGTYDTHQTNRHDFITGWKGRGLGEDHFRLSTRAFWTLNDKTEFVGGVEYEFDHFGDDWVENNFNISPEIQTDGSVTGLSAEFDKRIITPYDRSAFGVFGQGIVKPISTFTMLLGFRYDYIDAPIIEDKSAITPRINLIWTPIGGLIVKAMYSTGFRQAMAVLTSPDGYFLGHQKFQSLIKKPEHVQSTELCASYLLGEGARLSLNTFYNRFKNLHSLRSIAATEGEAWSSYLQFVSGGKVDYVGGEAVFSIRKKKYAANLSHQLVMPGYSKDDPYNVLLKPGGGDHIMFYPENVTKIMGGYSLMDWISINVNGIYIYESYGYSGNTVAQSGDYTLLNASLVLGKVSEYGELVLSGYNLLDENPKVPMPGTVGLGSKMTYLAGTNWNIKYNKRF